MALCQHLQAYIYIYIYILKLPMPPHKNKTKQKKMTKYLVSLFSNSRPSPNYI